VEERAEQEVKEVRDARRNKDKNSAQEQWLQLPRPNASGSKIMRYVNAKSV
jgi:hypothetical protein